MSMRNPDRDSHRSIFDHHRSIGDHGAICHNDQAENVMQDESEILFSVYSVFRIESIESVPKTIGIYRVQLKFTSDNDRQLQCHTERFEKEIQYIGGW
jgi:hypothetical protein